MASRHFTLRLDDDTYERLEAQRRRSGGSRSELARTLLDEGLRMADHPGVVFRAGPAGRRAGLAGGPDVWEVVRAAKEGAESARRGTHHAERVAAALGLTPADVRVALRYYAAYPEEIEDWLERVDEEAERAEEASRLEQALLE